MLRLQTGKTVTLVEGEGIDGWKLMVVRAESVLLHSGSTDLALTFPAMSGRTVDGPEKNIASSGLKISHGRR